MKNIGLFCKPRPSSVDPKIVNDLVQWLLERGCKLYMDEGTAELIGEEATCSHKEVLSISEMIIVLGGDGFCGWPTLLHLSEAG